MIFQNLEFHNVEVLEKTNLGVMLQRFPKEVRNQLGHWEHERGRFYSMASTCCEIRFVTDAPFFRISLSSLEADTCVAIYKGCFFHSVHRIAAGVVTTLHVETPPHLQQVEPSRLTGYPFSTDVWRIVFGKDACGIFCGLDVFDHTIRPPCASEKPTLKWLAYGSSITFGVRAGSVENSYVMQAARRVGADVFNKAIAGSCFCDPCIAKYFAEQTFWSFATLELGINMVGRFSAQEFEERASFLVQRLLQSNPGHPVVLLTPFPAHYLFDRDQTSESSRNFGLFGLALEKIEERFRREDLFLIHGSELLTDVSGLTTDLLHPSDYGHILIGHRLAEKLQVILKSCFP